MQKNNNYSSSNEKFQIVEKEDVKITFKRSKDNKSPFITEKELILENKGAR